MAGEDLVEQDLHDLAGSEADNLTGDEPGAGAEPAAEPAVTLSSFTEDDFRSWRARAIGNFAQDLALAHQGPVAQFVPQATAKFDDLLPGGRASDGHQLFRVRTGDVPIGWLWLGPHPRTATATWVYDIEIDPEYRGRGLGRATMLAAEVVARRSGHTEIGLNVFGHNARAEHLYRSLGYRIVATQMSKRVDGPAAGG